MSGTTDMTSWDLGQQEEDLENSKFRERAFHESIYCPAAWCLELHRAEGQTRTPEQWSTAQNRARLINIVAESG